MVAVRLDRAFLPGIVRQGNGAIVHITSIQCRLPLHESTVAYADKSIKSSMIRAWLSTIRLIVVVPRTMAGTFAVSGNRPSISAVNSCSYKLLLQRARSMDSNYLFLFWNRTMRMFQIYYCSSCSVGQSKTGNATAGLGRPSPFTNGKDGAEAEVGALLTSVY